MLSGTDATPNVRGIHKAVTLHGPLDASAQRRLRRVVEYCPVGQLLTKGALEIEDRIAWQGGTGLQEVVSPDAAIVPPLSSPWVAGAVSSHYLLDTKIYDTAGVLHHEGEVKLYLTCANLTRPGRWTLLAGHSEAGWVPSPVPLAYAALAASTVTTLQQAVAQDAWPTAGFQVDIAPYAGGNRDQSQASAAEGTRNMRRLVRTVVVHGEASAALRQAITAALAQDPLTASCRTGGMLLGDEVRVA